jgi:hypothetical protein
MKINIAKARARTGSRYPKPFDEPCQNKTRRSFDGEPRNELGLYDSPLEEPDSNPRSPVYGELFRTVR